MLNNESPYCSTKNAVQAETDTPTIVSMSRQLMCYICATNAGNTILRAHYAFMAHRNGMPISQLVNATSTEASGNVAADESVDAKQV